MSVERVTFGRSVMPLRASESVTRTLFWLLFTLAACVIIGRELVVSALREWMAELGQLTSVTVSYIGKVKTGFQMVAITALLAIDPAADENWLLALCYLVLYAAAILTLWSMVIYLRAARSIILNEDGGR